MDSVSRDAQTAFSLGARCTKSLGSHASRWGNPKPRKAGLTGVGTAEVLRVFERADLAVPEQVARVASVAQSTPDRKPGVSAGGASV